MSVAERRTPTLTIRGLETRAIRVPMRRPLVTSRGAITQAPIVLIDLETEEGVPGRAYLFAYSDLGARAVRGLLAGIVDMVRGDIVAPVTIAKKLSARFTLMGREGLPTIAMSGFDLALWDAPRPGAVRGLDLARGAARGAAAAPPSPRLRGGEPRPIPAYNSNALGLD